MILTTNAIRTHAETNMPSIGCSDWVKLIILKLAFFLLIENPEENNNKARSVGFETTYR